MEAEATEAVAEEAADRGEEGEVVKALPLK